MKRMEHVPAGEAGTVTMGTVQVGETWLVEVVVHATVLRLLPWYRGGMSVTTVVLPYGNGRLEIARAGIDGPYRLRARASNTVDKLPPVQLRVPVLPGMVGAEHGPEAVGYDWGQALLGLHLPVWARPYPEPRQLQVAGVA